MIVLSNIKKSYQSKKGGSHEALKGISLTLPSRGMVFLLGKSGSGKTTLLNIIGLLDTATEGTLEINGVVPEGKRLDDLRNQYSSFVFQDFALLENETIGQNVALALELQNVKDTGERVANALEKVGLAGYEKRLPAELSGGEKQRVAIARAIIKNSEIILADEPTGNLDSENGEEVFDILKSLSKDKLVLIVSHDRESAVKYADRIVEIKDGCIISDSAPEVAEEKKQADAGIKSHLPTLLALRMGWRNFGKKKLRSAMTFILATLAITVLAFAEVFASFTAERAIAKTIVQNDLDYITLKPFAGDPSDLSSNFGGSYINDDSKLRSVLDGVSYLEILYEKSFSYSRVLPQAYLVEDKAHLEAMGFELYDGSLELTDESVYVTDYMLDDMRRHAWSNTMQVQYGVREGDQILPIDIAAYGQNETLIGKTLWILMKYSGSGIEVPLAGIVKTDYKKYFDGNLVQGSTWLPDKGAEYSRIRLTEDFRRDNLYKMLYCTRNFSLHHLAEYTIDGGASKDAENFTLKGINYASYMAFSLRNNTTYSANDSTLIAESDTLKQVGNLTLNANEIVISGWMYNKLFGNEIIYDDFVDYYYDYELREAVYKVIKYPKHLGDTVSFSYTRNGNTLFEKDYTVVGITMDRLDEENSPAFYVGADGIAEFADASARLAQILVNVQNLREGKIRRLLDTLRYDYNIKTDFVYSNTIYANEPLQRLIGYGFLAVGAIMLIVTVLIVVSLISFNIIDQRKEIGILRALGARASDVAKIYLCQAGIVASVVFALSAVLSSVLIYALNAVFANYWIAGLVTVGFTGFSWIILIFGSFVALFLATSLPLRKISRQKPVDAIKNG